MTDTNCAICGESLSGFVDLARHPVYERGGLNYIELAHRSCAEENVGCFESGHWIIQKAMRADND